MAINKLTHAAQRAAFGTAIDAAIKAVRGKGTEHMAEEALKLIDLGEPFLKKGIKRNPLKRRAGWCRIRTGSGCSLRTGRSMRSIRTF